VQLHRYCRKRWHSVLSEVESHVAVSGRLMVPIGAASGPKISFPCPSKKITSPSSVNGGAMQ
jgi:hypothetical protein